MKTIMKIMLVLAIVTISIMNVKAQYLAEMPSAGFQSTSSMVIWLSENSPACRCTCGICSCMKVVKLLNLCSISTLFFGLFR